MLLHILCDHLTIVAIVITSISVWAFLRWGQDRNLNIPPGPNGSPLIGNLPAFLSSSPTDFFAECSKKFGDIFKLQLGQQRVFIVSCTDLGRKVFSNRDAQNRVPNVAYYKVFGRNAHGITFSSNGPCKDARRFLLGLFRDLGVGRGSFEYKILSEAERLAMNLGERVGKREADIKQKFFWAVSNITCGIVFGKQYEYDDPTLKQFVDFVETLFIAAGPGALFLTSPFLSALPFGPGSKALNCLRKFRKEMEKIINERISSFDPQETPCNVVDAFLLEIHNNPGNSGHINQENLLLCFVDLFVAGTETTTSTLSFAILFLTTHLQVQEKCQQELDLFIKGGGQLTYSERSRLPFLQAVIHETQRVSNVAPIGIPHLADKDIKLSGFDLPKGSAIAANMKVILMNDNVFENPEDFNPDRFIKDGAFEENPHVIPFSTGNRACLGEKLARMELFVFLSHLLSRYSFKPPKNVTMPSILNGIETAVTRSPLPYEVVISER
ncbi:Cytochrome P450 2J5 [Holothuria leucospilota]|uniref:Cytochrome P450 2J5 n=1 Tax=Holothuria leucospilota TaxID=206669 RepID=A0A9Q1BDZ3_HOLLE|nr:Cytochrome P450 2J5 [Holothuria leucospilota]